MRKYNWAVKGVIFMLAVWLVIYIGIPYFDDTKPMEPEKNLINLIIAIPAGVAFGWYRYKYLKEKFQSKQGKE
ncbi:hypothetical protein [Roseivirga sp. UBA1976]|jgi:hypothetical protein|uniref:hypothetical protein n=1 Tax=Roseivirga sp. UBA1976 TaxID=1947386 RepID=UPI00257AE390|nr:hypothetical protein [Roseivirga sp. UBA1976]MEC7754420.1 hypothetical protein [Bacteroidota bacterium]|tara:strand:+ start:661 stop:879 length:219 start_codon:yes stop_codon:yes gene_type:complete